MKTLARKVEEMLEAALEDIDTPKYFATFTDDQDARVRPIIYTQVTTGWNSAFEYKHGERTATIVVTLESNADDTKASDHDEIAAGIEANLGDLQMITEAAAGITAFTLVLWTPGESSTTTEERIRLTTFNYTARVRDDNRNNP